MNLEQELEFKTTFNRYKAEAREVLEELKEIAKQYELKKSSIDIDIAIKQLDNEAFCLMFLGIFSSGKSTLVNALLGKPLMAIPHLADGQAPMPVGKLPTTGILTSVKHGQTGKSPKVRALDFEGNWNEWDFKQYLEQAKLNYKDPQASKKFSKNIQEFEVDYPCRLTDANVVCIDSPGTSDNPFRTAITKNAFTRCDAAIFVYKSDLLADEASEEVIKQAEESGLLVVRVVNCMNNDRPGSEEFPLAVLWDRLVGNIPYTGQSIADFARRGVFFVNAQKALDGYFSDDEDQLADSGISTLQTFLYDFLLKERSRVRIERHVKAGLNQLNKWREMINEVKNKISTEMKELAEKRKEKEANLAEWKKSRERLNA